MPTPQHTHSCRDCKRVFMRLLEAVAGKVLEQHNLGLSTRLEDYKDSSSYNMLCLIHSALQQHRGYEKFVTAPRLRGTDYFLADYCVSVEFDESQHFTAPRCLTLSLYPPNLALGFDRRRWMDLCEQLNRKDILPPHRDEQRAWLDVLRDFSAVILGNQPTVRIYAGDETWCALDPAREEDVKAFARRHLPGVGFRYSASKTSPINSAIFSSELPGDVLCDARPNKAG